MAYNNVQQDNVKSSWIRSFIRSDDEVLMLLHSNHRIIVRRVPDHVYTLWVEAPSKGKFFHLSIKPFFQLDAG